MPLTITVAVVAAAACTGTMLLPGSAEEALYGYLLLFPNLVALGAPALLIGQEEESGTLAWQRSMPISWWSVAVAKGTLALVACGLLWLVCGAALLVAYATEQTATLTHALSGQAVMIEAYRLAGFNLMLIGCGFVTAWLIRSPAVGLLAVAPLATAGATAAIYGTIHVARPVSGGGYGNETTAVLWHGHFHLLFACLFGLVAAIAAQCRWTRPAFSVGDWLARTRGRQAYTPAVVLPPRDFRPGLRRALVWQSVRQSRGTYGAAAAVVLLVIAEQWIWSARSASISGWLFAGAAAAAGLVGIAAFGGDTTSGRYRFLAERGLGPWTVWWTRMLAPLSGLAAAMLVIIPVVLSTRGIAPEMSPIGNVALVVVSMLAAFAAGQMSSMWAGRPMIVYLGTPVLLTVFLMYGGFVLSFYQEYWWASFVAILLIVVASLSMCRRWSEGDRGSGFHLRWFGWLGIAAIGLVLPILVHRWYTAAPLLPQWRQQTIAGAVDLDPLPPLLQRDAASPRTSSASA